MSIFGFLGMEGLIKANLKVYFDSIKHGVEHRDAMSIVLKSRYRFGPDKMEEVEDRWEGWRLGETQLGITKSTTQADVEKDELRTLLRTMYLVEMHVNMNAYIGKIRETMNKFNDKFTGLYDSLKAKYKVKEGFHIS